MRRRTLFLITTLLIPVLFFAVLELVLMACGYGSDLDLIVGKQIAGREYYAVNRTAGRRYFPPGSFASEPHEDFFLAQKEPGTLRIFCLGESTMAGFPSEFNATAPAMLKTRLESEIDGRRIEVINGGLAAVSSYPVRNILEIVLEYEPDLIILYVGHNEFYGALGASSATGATNIPWLTDLYLALLRFRTFRLARDLQGLVTEPFADDLDGTMMQQVARNEAIREDGDEYLRAREIFRANLSRMIRASKEASVPLLVSTLVSNISTFPPFLSYREAAPTGIPDRFGRLLATADSLQKAGSNGQALKTYREALAVDPSHAGAWFAAGSMYHAEGRIPDARRAFERARDLDGLRFRMSGVFQEDLIQLCAEEGIPVARIDSTFASLSADGLPGRNLILEHVHPNIRGYRLIADTWRKAIYRYDLLGPKTLWRSEPKPIRFLSGITEFDYAVERIRIDILTRRWPFADSARNPFLPANKVEEIALRYIRKEIPWQTARYEVAAVYVNERAFELARREAYAVSRVIPYSYEPLLRIGDYYFMEGLTEKALSAYGDCIRVEENPFAYSKMGLIRLQREEFSEAISDLQKALALHEEGPYELPENILASNYYLTGYAFIRKGKLEDGKESLRAALQINPGFAEAEQLLTSIDRRR